MTVKTLNSSVAFDLNIERILEHWEPRCAVREIITNAMDEQELTGSQPPRTSKVDGGVWGVRDFGRGLQPRHLTQAENEEKLANPGSIGKFGIGVKNALTSLDSHHIELTIMSRHARMRTCPVPKHGSEEIQTLQVLVGPPRDPRLEGTLFSLRDLPDEEMAAAKQSFLRFSGDRALEETNVAAILEREVGAASVYVNGVRVAEEERFLFGYDVRSMTAATR